MSLPTYAMASRLAHELLCGEPLLALGQARHALREGDPAEALTSVRRFQQRPVDGLVPVAEAFEVQQASAFSLEGSALEALGRSDEAIGAFGRSAALFDALADDHHERDLQTVAEHATALVAVGRHDEAVALTELPLRHGSLPAEGPVLQMSAKLIEGNQVDRARALLQAAVARGPVSLPLFEALDATTEDPVELVHVRLALIECRLDEGNWDAALTLADDLAHDLGPKLDAPLFAVRIGVLLSAGRTDDAAAEYQAANAELTEGDLRRPILEVGLAVAGRADIVEAALQRHNADKTASGLLEAAALLRAMRSREALTLLRELPSDRIVLRLRAAGYEQLGAWDSAADTLRQALETAPDDSDLLGALARLDALSGRDDTALDAVENKLRRRPWDALLLGARAAVMAVRGQPEEAIRTAEQALRISPSLRQPRKALAHGLIETGRVEQGLEEAERILRDDPDDFDALYVKGRALYEAGEATDAVMVLSRLRSVAPWHRAGALCLAAALEAVGDLDEAARHYDDILAENPVETEPYLAAARLAWRTWRLSRAEEILLKALEAEPENPEVDALLGDTLRRAERLSEAEKYLRRALESEPERAEWLGTLGQVRLAEGESAEGLRLLRRAIDLEPGLSWAYAEIGEALRLQGRLEEAVVALNTAIELNPSSAWAFAVRGAVRLLLGLFDDALADVQRSLELDENFAFVWAVKANIHMRIDDLPQARVAIDTSIEKGERGWVLATRGAIKWLANDPVESIMEDLQAALADDALDVHALVGLGFARLRAGDVAAARGDFERATTDLAARRRRGEALELIAAAWAFIGLGRWETAANVASDSVAQEPGDVTIGLDYGLAVACATALDESVDFDPSEYASAIRHITEMKDARYRSYLRRQAGRDLDNLEVAILADSSSPHLRKALASCRQILEEHHAA